MGYEKHSAATYLCFREEDMLSIGKGIVYREGRSCGYLIMGRLAVFAMKTLSLGITGSDY